MTYFSILGISLLAYYHSEQGSAEYFDLLQKLSILPISFDNNSSCDLIRNQKQ